jgi:hypothetical protein
MEKIEDQDVKTLVTAIRDLANQGRAKNAADVETRWLSRAELGVQTMSASASQLMRQAPGIS